jgi:hypothetical protein
MAIFDLNNYGVKLRKHIPNDSDELRDGSYSVYYVDATDEDDAKRKAKLKFPANFEAFDVWLYSKKARHGAIPK